MNIPNLLSKRLRKDLQAYLIGETDNHPLTRIDLVEVRFYSNLTEMNRQYDEKMKALDNALERKNFLEFVHLHPPEHRAKALYELSHRFDVNEQELWPVVGTIWCE